MATIRYLVTDVEAAVAFYVEALGFEVVQQFPPAMAILKRGDLTLWTAGPPSSAARPMPDGRAPQPGGWNRMVREVEDIDASVAALEARGGDVIQILLASALQRRGFKRQHCLANMVLVPVHLCLVIFDLKGHPIHRWGLGFPALRRHHSSVITSSPW